LTNRPDNEDAERFRQRLLRHKDEVWTYLDHPQIEPTHNRAERQLRPSVIMRKVTFGNRSDTGTMNHTVLMGLMQTAKLNGANPLHILHLLTHPDNHQNGTDGVNSVGRVAQKGFPTDVSKSRCLSREVPGA
jgi:hypothetical protein